MIKRTNLVYGKSLIRCFASASTDPIIKPNLSLLSKIRKVTQLPMNKIKESLIKNSNSYDDAMKWLNNEMANNQSKVEKLSGRIANEGLITVVKSPSTVLMCETNSESDFVSRSAEFIDFSETIAKTILLSTLIAPSSSPTSELTQIPINEDLMQFPIDQVKSINEYLREKISLLGENLVIKKAVSIQSNKKGIFNGAYIHSSSPNSSTSGRIGSIVSVEKVNDTLTDEQVDSFLKKLAQHIVAMSPVHNVCDGNEDAVLLEDQEFFAGGGKVSDVLAGNGLKIIAWERFEVGK